MLKRGSSGGIYIHPWDITDEGIDDCYDFLDQSCGLNELFVAAAYHASTFVLPHNPKRLVRWDDGGIYFTPKHARWGDTSIQPALGSGVDSDSYLTQIVDKARDRYWGVLFFVVFHYSVPLPTRYPHTCCIDALGEPHRTYLCPSNPDVRSYDLALVEELLDTYSGDGIRHESLGFGGWNQIALCNKVEVLPTPRDQFLLSLCFCEHCVSRAHEEDVDALSLRDSIRDHLYRSLPQNPTEWDDSAPDEQWARNVFGGQLWRYLDVRCNTVSSLFGEVQNLCNSHDAAFMPFGTRNDRDVMACNDYSLMYPHLKRVSLGATGNDPVAQRTSLQAAIEEVPHHAEPEIMHNQRSFDSSPKLTEAVMLARDVGIRHHSFHYYGMSRRHELEWIGDSRDAWAKG